MKISRFILLVLATIFSTYWMNAALLAGEYWLAVIFGFFVFRNLRFSYRVTKAIQLFDIMTKKKD